MGRLYLYSEYEPEPEPIPIPKPSRRSVVNIGFKAQTKYGELVYKGQLVIPPFGSTEEEEAKRYYSPEETGSCDLRLSSTHDLLIVNNDIDLTYNIEKVRQNLKIRLQSFTNDWFLDTSDGIDYFGIVFIKDPDTNLIDGIIKTIILETEDIIEILEYSSSIDVETRQ